MHKKKNSASVLAGEMIITFYKPAKARRASAPAESPPEAEAGDILSEAFDTCLKNGERTFTSELLFNRLIVELWRRRALRCLSLNRREFVKRLEQRGWRYNTRSHTWSRAQEDTAVTQQTTLFTP